MHAGATLMPSFSPNESHYGKWSVGPALKWLLAAAAGQSVIGLTRNSVGLADWTNTRARPNCKSIGLHLNEKTGPEVAGISSSSTTTGDLFHFKFCGPVGSDYTSNRAKFQPERLRGGRAITTRRFSGLEG